MQNRLPTIAIMITSATYAGFAIWIGLQPQALLDAFEIESSTPQMLTEIRAFYGGIEMAIAVVMIVLWKRGELYAALLVGGIPLAGSALGRLFGMMVDDYSALHLGFAIIEALGSVFCLLGCVVISRQEKRKIAA